MQAKSLSFSSRKPERKGTLRYRALRILRWLQDRGWAGTSVGITDETGATTVARGNWDGPATITRIPA